MRLQDLERFDEIVIQCHDHPDADAFASGFGLYRYFTEKGKRVRFLYSGRSKAEKSNLVLMLSKLGIPVEYVTGLTELPKLLIMADCQYGGGNVTRFEAEEVAVVDHHERDERAALSEVSDAFCEIRSSYGSCATLVWQLLTDAGYDVNADLELATALYYGLYMDTGQFGDIYHPMDKDMRDALHYDRGIFSQLKNTNLSSRELEIAGDALLHHRILEDLHFAVVKVKPCDANILGIVSDFVLQTDIVNTCVIYSALSDGYKLSFRSCEKEIKASDLAAYMTEGIGSGGGHAEKAGGFIRGDLFAARYPGEQLETYFERRMTAYLKSYEVIDAKEYEIDLSGMKRYRKKNLPLGFVELGAVYPMGTPLLVRTLEGDLEINVTDDIYLMVGIRGEVYPIRAEKFARTYRRLDEPYLVQTEYIPSVHNRLDGSVRNVSGFVKSCVPTGETFVYARRLERQVKIFTAWDTVNYVAGAPGDMLAVRTDDLHDIYSIEQHIFEQTYEDA
ncbi:MAG: DHH family phosphoesterase [bacterium]|nr:DHH family phosphoesterase [bacterium]